MTMSFWDLVQNHVDTWGARESAIMRRAGLNKGTFTAWRQRGIPALPTHQQLVRLADTLHVDYELLLETILRDLQYLPEAAARQRIGGAEESQRLAESEQRWGPVIHEAVSELLMQFDVNVQAALEHQERVVVTGGDAAAIATRDYLKELADGEISFVIEDRGGDGDAQDELSARRSAPNRQPASGPGVVEEAAYTTGDEIRGRKARRQIDEAGEESQERPGTDDGA